MMAIGSICAVTAIPKAASRATATVHPVPYTGPR